MIVAKFGGTSVSSKRSIFAICQIIKSIQDKEPIVVVSALSGVTDLLLNLPTLSETGAVKQLEILGKIHHDLIDDVFAMGKDIKHFINQQCKEIAKFKFSPDKKNLDKLASFGETMSAYIVTKALEQKGIPAVSVLATELIVTNDNFGSADFILGPTQRRVNKALSPLINNGTTPVVTGFIGATSKNQVTTLGRGGSDYTASIIGFCLKAQEIQIWTDVDGIFSADPRLVKSARPLEEVSFREAAELATFGAKVLHPRTIHPAIKMGIPVRVLNTFNPSGQGTKISKNNTGSKKIKAISFKKKITLVNIYSTEMFLQKGFLAKIFNIFAKNNISVDLVSVSEVSVSVTLDNTENLTKALAELSQFTNVTVSAEGMVSLIGEGITDSTSNIKNIFYCLDKAKILAKMVSLGATNINISIVLKSDQVEKAVKVLHKMIQ